MDEGSITSSFYEPVEEYDEGKTRMLYQSLKENFQDIKDTLSDTLKHVTNLEKQTSITTKLIETIQSANPNEE